MEINDDNLNHVDGEVPREAIYWLMVCMVMLPVSIGLLITYAATKSNLAFYVGVITTAAGAIISGYWVLRLKNDKK